MLLVVAWNEMHRRQHVRKISVELQNEYTHSTDDERQPNRWSQRNRRIDARKSAQDPRLMFFRSWFHTVESESVMDGGQKKVDY
jgi:hypothetical protein